jgi:signal transduction histidine kinase
MRIRYFGIVFMLVVVAVPIGLLAYMTTKRAERTAVFEVRLGNDRLAKAVANQLTDYVRGERRVVADYGEVAVQATESLQRSMLEDAFLIKNRHIKSVAVYDNSGTLVIGEARQTDGLKSALAGRHFRTSVPGADADRALGHMIHIAEPIVVAGKQRGAVLAKIDLVGIWEPVSAITIGRSGFVRLLTMDGVLLAHGNPEERRKVDNPDADVSSRLLAGALSGQIVRNSQGDEVIATAAMLPAIDSIVLVEQPAGEAYNAVASMKAQLIIIAGSTLLFALLVGFGFGGHIVRGLERLRRHTRVLAGGDLTATVDAREISRVKEIRGLADAVNEMAGDLDELQRDMKERERIDTFARVAAGLAHDLRHPIEAIRGAWLELAGDPDDPDIREHVAHVAEKHLPRLSRFMSDLTRLARSGDLDVELEPHDALELAGAVIDEIAAAPKFRGIEFEATGEPATVEVDRELVKRALYNLANNGAEACLEKGRGGSVAIRVSHHGDEVDFSVTDTGPGIEPERIAEVLSSNLKSTKRSTGVGLGLGVVRQVAESHSGVLDLESEVGKGCTFILTLPGRDSGNREESFNEPEAQAV